MTQQHQSCERSRQAVHLRFTANLRSCRIIAVFSRKEVLFSLFLTVIPMSNHLNVIVIYVLYFSKLYQMCRFNFPVQLQCFGRKNKCHQQKKKRRRRKGSYLGTEELNCYRRLSESPMQSALLSPPVTTEQVFQKNVTKCRVKVES